MRAESRSTGESAPEKETRCGARGIDACSPWRIGGRGLLEALKRAGLRLLPGEIGLAAAGIAFFGLLALFPGIAALIAIAGILLDPGIVTAELQTTLAALPEGARSILADQVRTVTGTGEGELGLAAVGGLALALFWASRGVANLLAGLNLVYDETEARGILHLAVLNLALTLFIILVVILALVLVAVIPAVLALAGDAPLAGRMAALLRWPVLIVVGALAFSVLYRYGPSRRNARWRWLAPGGLAACLLWAAATAGFSWYVETLGRYGETFGALGGVIVLLMWLWLSSYAVLVGGLIDAELEAQTARDSTVGPDRPRGTRGAVKADACAPCDEG
jgi:membrane protein